MKLVEKFQNGLRQGIRWFKRSSLVRSYSQSYDPRILKTIPLDFASVLVVALLFLLYTSLIVIIGNQLTGGLGTDELTAQLLAGDPAQMETFAGTLRLFVFGTFVGGLVFLLASLCFYVYSRYKIYQVLDFLPSRSLPRLRVLDFAKWFLLILLYACITFVGALFYLLLRFIFLALLGALGLSAHYFVIIGNVLNAGAIIFFLLFFFVLKFEYLRTSLIWSSIGNSFTSLWNFRKNLFRLFLLQFGAYLLLIGFSLFFVVRLFPQSFNLPSLLELVLFLLFLSWSRSWFLRHYASLREVQPSSLTSYES